MHLEGFEKLPQLEFLTLENNLLTTITDKMFTGLWKIKSLNLKSNKIRMIETFLLGDIESANQTQLESVDLSHNWLVTITSKMFKGLWKIKYLNLKNKITTIESFSFGDLQLLKKLDLTHNELKTLQHNLFKTHPEDTKHPSNVELILSGNKLFAMGPFVGSELQKLKDG